MHRTGYPCTPPWTCPFPRPAEQLAGARSLDEVQESSFYLVYKMLQTSLEASLKAVEALQEHSRDHIRLVRRSSGLQKSLTTRDETISHLRIDIGHLREENAYLVKENNELVTIAATASRRIGALQKSIAARDTLLKRAREDAPTQPTDVMRQNEDLRHALKLSELRFDVLRLELLMKTDLVYMDDYAEAKNRLWNFENPKKRRV